MSAEVGLAPLAAQGAVDPGLSGVTATTHFWAVPWILLAAVILLLGLLAWWLHRRRHHVQPCNDLQHCANIVSNIPTSQIICQTAANISD